MKRIIGLTFMVLLLSLCTSCEKEESLTDREKIESELKAFVKANNVTTCHFSEFYNNNLVTEYSDCKFSIDNGFFVIYLYDGPTEFKIYYNLSFLYRYYIGYNNIFHLEFYKN